MPGPVTAPITLIWVGKPHKGKYPDLDSFHYRGIFVANVIISQQMQGSMNQKMYHMIVKRLSRIARFAGTGFKGDGNIAQFRVGGRLRRAASLI